MAVHEVMTITEEIERIIVNHGHSDEIRKAALASGMVTMRQAGLAEVAAGVTSIEEILRVIS